MARCSSWRWARLAGLSRHLASGRRRQAPLPVQGASKKTRSKRGAERRQRRSHRRPAAPERCARLPASAARRSGAGGQHRRRRHRPARCCAWLRQTPASCRRRRHKYRAPAGGGRLQPSARRPASLRPAPRTSPCRARLRPRHWAAGPALRAPEGERPIGENGVGTGENRAKRLQHLLAVGLERVDPQVDRRPARQRCSLPPRRPRRTRAATRARANRGNRRAREPECRRAAPEPSLPARPRSAARRHRPTRRRWRSRRPATGREPGGAAASTMARAVSLAICAASERFRRRAS